MFELTVKIETGVRKRNAATVVTAFLCNPSGYIRQHYFIAFLRLQPNVVVFFSPNDVAGTNLSDGH